ncbi:MULTISPECIES: hypothetical protein [unclassified Bradyrhizobium]
MRKPIVKVCISAGAMIALGLGICAGAVMDGGRTSRQALDAKDRPSLIMMPDREFSATSYVHAGLPPDAPRDSHSDKWVAALQSQIKSHYGIASVNIDRYSPPLYVVSRDQPTVRVRAERATTPNWQFDPLQRQWDSVPLPVGFRPSSGTDAEAVVYQPSTARYWEFWGMEPSGRKTTNSAGESVDEWRASWGGRIDNLATSPGYFPTTGDGYKFGATATGLALLAGLITVAEQRRGEINHALHIALPQTRRSVWVDPAQRTDGEDDDPDAIPEGTTFRIPSSVDLDDLDMDPYAAMLARAAQRYGIVVRDTAGAVVFYAENPLSKGPDHPYYGIGGILQCPKGYAVAACYPDGNNRLRGFPWHLLEAIQSRRQQ